VLIQDFHVEANGLLAGKGIEIAADGVHFARDPLRRARLGPLEDHVLDEMGDAVQFRHLVAGARAHPHTHGDRAHVLHALGKDRETTG